MTIHEIKDTRRGDFVFSRVTRAYYKKVITITDKAGAPFRTGTLYRDGVPVKQLTLLGGQNG